MSADTGTVATEEFSVVPEFMSEFHIGYSIYPLMLRRAAGIISDIDHIGTIKGLSGTAIWFDACKRNLQRIFVRLAGVITSMDHLTVIRLLAISFPLGMLHALDPDHVLAVATLTGREKNPARALFYAFHWAVGHGGLLLLITVAVLGFHFVLPQSVPYWAERSVGIILILTGTSVLWNIRKERLHGHESGHAHPHMHMHAGGPIVHSHPVGEQSRRSAFRAPFLIGIVHGTAGSAPFLALLPAAFLSPLMGILYVAIFSVGVMVGMLSFAMLLRQGQGWLGSRAEGLGHVCRGAFAVAALGAGVFWLAG